MASGSDTAADELVLRLGVSDFHIRDQYLGPRVYSGPLFWSGVSYRTACGNARHTIDAGFGVGHTSAVEQQPEASQYVGHASYMFLISLHVQEMDAGQLEFFFGPGLSTYFTTTDIVTPESITWYGATDKTWYWSHALDLNVTGECRMSGGQVISVKLNLPVVRIVSRPDAGHNFSGRNIDVRDNFLAAASGGSVKALWNSLALVCELEYRQRLSEQFDVGCTYRFAYASSTIPLNMGMYANTLLAGIAWRP
jgi:hypothetical protein